ncbi:putative vacuolar protein sorting-associated protein [Phaeomoniella chlamydospora]|uniref:Vacuolar protein sorting-associated protein 28 n=1 Tax=Phaeomoniella chlamydospora TaxID=158046 RepID=A0A0G2E2W5_PHACM|nr:putative vacuolar protein sorting-associated protein [Phaeomoniella chlamydospora]
MDEPTIDMNQEVKLAETAAERDLLDSLAEIYSIIRTLDGLEKAYIKDAITEQEYTEFCSKLLKQYKSILSDETVSREFVDLDSFARKWKIECPRAIERLRIGLPSTVALAQGHTPQPSIQQGHDNALSTASPAPAPTSSGPAILSATENFITFLDALRLNLTSKDALHPLLTEVIQSVNKVTEADFEGRARIIHWLIVLNGMRATQDLTEDQVRELSFDMEQAYNGFKSMIK